MFEVLSEGDYAVVGVAGSEFAGVFVSYNGYRVVMKDGKGVKHAFLLSSVSGVNSSKHVGHYTPAESEYGVAA